MATVTTQQSNSIYDDFEENNLKCIQESNLSTNQFTSIEYISQVGAHPPSTSNNEQTNNHNGKLISYLSIYINKYSYRFIDPFFQTIVQNKIN